ncbi:MAG: N-acetylmuramoyl-L-alanine amidase-like domain-containing protein [Nitrospirota bacterium]
MQINTGKWSRKEVDAIIHKASEINDPGDRIAFLSGQFLGIDYKESTLTGSPQTPEVFVINFQGVDCFTYIDYIEAMRLSGSFSEFKENLKKVRYRGGNVAFENRNHFFTDWSEFNSGYIDDVTDKIGKHKTKRIMKMLNRKDDGTYFIPGIKPKQREIRYIQADIIDDSVFNGLRSGDYAGVYSEINGLDVSHVGIIIRDIDMVYLRHASRNERKIIDQDFGNYISGKPGLIVLRPRKLLN